MKLSIIIPCYNEADNIPLIYDRLKEIITDRKDIEIILVNNGSTDNSKEVFSNCIDSTENSFKVHNIDVNQGYGFGILSGLSVASGDVLSWTHADMQTDPLDVIKAFDLFKVDSNGKFIIKGKRKSRRLIEAFFTFGMQLVAYYYLRVYMDDINAQPKMFDRNFYISYIKDKAPYDFSLDLFLLYTALKEGYNIKTIPVYFAKRQHGEAKGGGSFKTRIKLIKRTFSYIKELNSKING